MFIPEMSVFYKTLEYEPSNLFRGDWNGKARRLPGLSSFNYILLTSHNHSNRKTIAKIAATFRPIMI